MKKILLFAAIILPAILNAQTFTPMDKDSKVHFVIKNFGINTGGDLSGLKGKIKFDAKNPASASFDVTADVFTVDTDNEKRDTHLKSEDYFDAQKYSVIRLVSTKIERGSDITHFIFKGKITIKNITKAIQFPFTAQGKNAGAVFTGAFEINRIDFGVGQKSATMSDKVKVSLSVFALAD